MPDFVDLKYELVIWWSHEDNCFFAEAPELPGCMTDGNTYREVLENAEEAMALWIDVARERGRPIPEPRGRLMYA